MAGHAEPIVDAVIVSYNSSRTLRQCVEALLEGPLVRVHVVDNNSTDGAPDSIADLAVQCLRQHDNLGFAHGCNIGWRAGTAPYVLLVNPDAVLDPLSLGRMIDVLEADPRVGIVGPRTVDADGTLEFSQRRFPRLRSTFAQALFVHRLFPHATWADELVRDPADYQAPASPAWISGACMLARRDLVERISGLDEGFFLYGEDVDFCRRARDAGYNIRYEPSATLTHVGGVSAPRASLLPILAASRIRYARTHEGPVESRLTRVGVALGALTHALVSTGGSAVRRGHARALMLALAPRDVDDPAALAAAAVGARPA